MSAYYEPGRYVATIIRQALGESKEKKTPQFVLTLSVDGRVNPVDPDGDLISVSPGECKVFMYLTQATAEFTAEKLKLLGYNRESLRFLDPNTPGFHDFSGQQINVYCKHEDYKGKPQEKWDLARDEVAGRPLDAKAIRNLDALFGKHLKGSAKPAIAPQAEHVVDEAKRLAAAGSLPDDDSIPF